MTDAEKKWDEWDNKNSMFDYTMEGFISSVRAREAYKQALREAIEKYLNNAMKEPAHQYNGGLIDAYKTVLEEMNKVTPK